MPYNMLPLQHYGITEFLSTTLNISAQNDYYYYYLFRSSKYRYNEAYTIWNNELVQQGWLTSTNNCPSHTHAYTHTHTHTPTDTSTYIHTQCNTIWSRLKHFKNWEKFTTLTVLLKDRNVLKSTVSDGMLFHTLIMRWRKNDFLALTSLYFLNSLNGCPRVVTTVLNWKKSSNFTSVRPNTILQHIIKSICNSLSYIMYKAARACEMKLR